MCLKVTGNDDYLLQALKTARTVVAPPSWVWAIRLFLWRNGGGAGAISYAIYSTFCQLGLSIAISKSVSDPPSKSVFREFVWKGIYPRFLTVLCKSYGTWP